MVALVQERPEFSQRQANPLVPGVRRALRHRPITILLASYVAYTIGAGTGPILLPFFIAYVLQPPHPAMWLITADNHAVILRALRATGGVRTRSTP
jgi:hypothetical protein